jgi:ABC-type lipoprotein release transport system permease subunit
VADYQRVEQVLQRELPELDFMVQRGRGFGKIISDRGSALVALSGVDVVKEPRLQQVLDVYEGNLHDLAQPSTILLFEEQAKRLDVKVGDAITISVTTNRGVANTIDCRVVGLAREAGLLSTFNVFVSAESLRTLYQLRADVTGVVQVYVKPAYLDELAPIAERLRGVLDKAGYRVLAPDARAYWFKIENIVREDWTGQKLDVTTWEDELSFLMWTFSALQALSLILMVILVGIMVAGIMNTLWIAIRERTREIGTLRAIGMQRFGVMRLFLLEASLLGVLGAMVGALLGALLTWLLNALSIHVPTSVQLFLMRDTLRLVVEPQMLISSIMLIAFVTGAAAIYPAIRAASRKPVDAMAHFG